MNGLARILLAGLLVSGAAHAQQWQTYTYPNPGFAIQFPGVPEVQTTTFRNAVGVTLPLTRYVLRQEGVQYTLSVVNYSTTNADALSIIGETVKSFRAKGKVTSNTGARVNGSSGRELTMTEGDGSRSDIAIFFFDHHLYTAVGRALPPNPLERSADTGRFQQSLQFLGDDSGFFGLFSGRGRTSSNTAANAATGGSGTNEVSASTGTGTGTGTGGSHAGERRPKTTANQRADAACVGRSPGDVVQLETPTGAVPATCTLTARPNTPSRDGP